MAFVGFRRFYPAGSGSGSSGKQAFTCAVRFASQLSFAHLSLTFGAVFYRSPDIPKIKCVFQFCNFFNNFFNRKKFTGFQQELLTFVDKMKMR